MYKRIPTSEKEVFENILDKYFIPLQVIIAENIAKTNQILISTQIL